MFGIGTTELVVILVIALLVLGPKKLPQVARSLGKAMGEFKKVSTDVKRTIDLEVDRLEKEEADEKAKKDLRVDKEAKPKTPRSNPEPQIVSPTHAAAEPQEQGDGSSAETTAEATKASPSPSSEPGAQAAEAAGGSKDKA